MKDDKRLKNQKKVNYPDKNCIKLSLNKKPSSKNRKFKWNEHRKVTRKEWKGMKDEIEKNTYEKYNVFKNLQKTSNPDKNLHKISIKTNKKTRNLFEMNIEKSKKLVKSTFENNRMKHEIGKKNENKNKQEKKEKVWKWVKWNFEITSGDRKEIYQMTIKPWKWDWKR